MRTNIAVAAALAAGLTAFAASAETPTPISVRAQEASYLPGKALALTKATVSPRRPIVSQRGDGGDTTVRTVMIEEEKPAKSAARKTAGTAAPKAAARKKGRERIVVDPITTAAISAQSTTTVHAHGAYGAIISRYAAVYGVPVTLAHAVVRVESNYRPNLRGSAGEIGLMQIKPATARMMGYSGGASGLFNPETNIKYGMKYLGMAHDLGDGTTCGTILKYNAGHGARRMNPVSSAYCRKIKAHIGG